MSQQGGGVTDGAGLGEVSEQLAVEQRAELVAVEKKIKDLTTELKRRWSSRAARP